MLLQRALPCIASCTRGTDLLGWCDEGQALGVIFTEIKDGRTQAAVEILRAKVKKSLRENLGADAAQVSVHAMSFPTQAGSGTLPN